MQQRKDEPFRSFMAWYNEQLVGVPNLIIPLTVIILLKGLKDEHFKMYLSKNTPKTIVELRLRTKKYKMPKKPSR